MAQDYNEYLGINVLNEQQILSLFKQSTEGPQQSGEADAIRISPQTKRKKVEPIPQTNGIHSQDSDDAAMMPSSSAPKPDEKMEESVSIRSVMLVKEEHFEQAKAQFDSISSIHIYSLEANGLGDVQALTECNRKIAASYTSEDPLQAWKQYGTIQNPNAKRRTRLTAPPPPAPIEKNAEAKTKPIATVAKAKEAEMKAVSKEFLNKSTTEAEKKGIPKPVQTKRQNSDIFKSFAKGETKAKQESQSSAEASPAPQPEDEPMGGFSDDDDIAIDALEEQQPEVTAPTSKSKKEREAELQAMMDQEDEQMEDATTPAEEVDEEAPETGKAESPKEEEPTETVTVENGRRRGKRRIMKKKKVKDEEGYLVTIEEPAWESFSEEEPETKKVKMQPAASLNSGSKPAMKKAAKQGQGNIMSFFSKK